RLRRTPRRQQGPAHELRVRRRRRDARPHGVRRVHGRPLGRRTGPGRMPAERPPARAARAGRPLMNWFAGLEIRILEILADGATEPLKFVYEAGNKQPDLHVQIIDYSRVSIREGRTEAVSFDLVELASPGCAVRVGTRDLHLQCLRADNPL